MTEKIKVPKLDDSVEEMRFHIINMNLAKYVSIVSENTFTTQEFSDLTTRLSFKVIKISRMNEKELLEHTRENLQTPFEEFKI